MRSDRVFITGASGFIGSHVAAAFARAGYRVRGLAHEHRVGHAEQRVGSLEPTRSHAAQPAQLPRDDGAPSGSHVIEWVNGDVCRAGELVRSLADCRYLVHCAALYSFAPVDRARLREVNVAGTARLLEAARIAGIERAVVTSSSATVGPSRDGRPADETCNAAHCAVSAYHHSKVEQERVAIAARVPVVLVLPTAPVGPGDHKPTPTGRIVLDFACGRMPARPSGGGLNVVSVEDVAVAHVAALERGRPKERYIAGGENLSFDRLWELLAAVTGRPVPPWRVPHTIALAAAYADEIRCRLQPHAVPVVPLEGVQLSREYMYADSAKAERELGYRAGSARDALARAVAWYRAHGYIAA